MEGGIKPGRVPVGLRGFTILEMCVVVGIVIILVAIIVPALSNAKESTRSMTCGSNQRQLMLGFLMFSRDHNGSLPGSQFDVISAQSDPLKRDWMMGGNQDITKAPQFGTIFPYVSSFIDRTTNNAYGIGSSYKLYLCPSYFVGAPPGSSYSSNGHFDYTGFLLFAGARVSSIKPVSRLNLGNGSLAQVITPVIVEEDPAYGIGNKNVEVGHCNSDQLGHNHFGGANYASIDGSVQRFTEPTTLNANSWTTIGPSGKPVSMGSNGCMFGWFNSQ